MRIAVVDDESMFTMQLKMIIEKLSKQKELPLEVETFSSGEAFIDELSSKRFDVVFMDIYMENMDGIATATRLRELTERIFLIFMTASGEHYPDAFALHAFDYVTKPFTLERIEKVLDEIIDHTPMDEDFVKISIGAQSKKIYLRDITAVTTDGHYLDIFLESGESYRSRMTASEFTEATRNSKRFMAINRGIIINMDFIEDANTKDITLTDGSSFPVSTKKAAAILQAISDYRFSKK